MSTYRTEIIWMCSHLRNHTLHSSRRRANVGLCGRAGLLAKTQLLSKKVLQLARGLEASWGHAASTDAKHNPQPRSVAECDWCPASDTLFHLYLGK